MEKARVSIILLSNDPKKAYPALMLALAAAAEGAGVDVHCAMDGVEVVSRGGAAKITMPSMPPLAKMYEDAKELGVKFYACAPSREAFQLMGIKEEDLDEDVKMEDASGYMMKILPIAERGKLLTFVF